MILKYNENNEMMIQLYSEINSILKVQHVSESRAALIFSSLKIAFDGRMKMEQTCSWLDRSDHLRRVGDEWSFHLINSEEEEEKGQPNTSLNKISTSKYTFLNTDFRIALPSILACSITKSRRRMCG